MSNSSINPATPFSMVCFANRFIMKAAVASGASGSVCGSAAVGGGCGCGCAGGA